MCGFVGIIDPRGSPASSIAHMTEALVHRGPNDAGLVYGDLGEGLSPTPHPGRENYPLMMGFRRLSILDLSPNAHQPMSTPDGRFTIVFNGEIYNYRELREWLLGRSVSLKSTGDTEVLLHLYALQGPAMLQRLNGMFALAIYDRDQGTLFLARDRLGIKPLYYYREGNLFLYASEAKAFLYHPAFNAELDPRKISEYLLFRYIAGNDSLLLNVKSVEPGTYVLHKEGKFERTVYWSVPVHDPRPMTVKAGVEAVNDLLRSSVEMQLISDVKVGCQLSGGVDSSLVSYWASKLHGGWFDSVSITLDDPWLSEGVYIDEVKKQLQLKGHQACLDVDYILDEFARATWHNDFPLNTPNSIGILRLAQEAKRHVTVLLSGEGADEVFGGYERFYLARRYLFLRRFPGASRFMRPHPLLGFSEDRDEVLIGLSAYGRGDLIRSFYPRFSKDEAIEGRLALWRRIQDQSDVEKLLSYEQKTYMVDLLLRQDKMCMAESIENRVPFLDHRLVEFAKTLPTSLKVAFPWPPLAGKAMAATKPVIKGSAAGIYGKTFAFRAKSGFPMPLDALFRSESFQERFAAYRRILGDLGLFEMRAIDGLYASARDHGGDHSKMLWILIALAEWKKEFLDFRQRSTVRTERSISRRSA